MSKNKRYDFRGHKIKDKPKQQRAERKRRYKLPYFDFTWIIWIVVLLFAFIFVFPFMTSMLDDLNFNETDAPPSQINPYFYTVRIFDESCTHGLLLLETDNVSGQYLINKALAKNSKNNMHLEPINNFREWDNFYRSFKDHDLRTQSICVSFTLVV